MPRSQRADYNAWAEDYIRFQVWIDTCLGIEPSPDRPPYDGFNRPAVAALLRRVDRDNPVPTVPQDRVKRRRRAPALTPTNGDTAVTPRAPVEIYLNDALPEWL